VLRKLQPLAHGTRTFFSAKKMRVALAFLVAFVSRVLFFSFMLLLYKKKEKVALNRMQCSATQENKALCKRRLRGAQLHLS
jgi:hypothetical protein